MRYNWQQKDWPNFQYRTDAIEDLLFDFAQRTGRISGVLDSFSESEQAEAMINLMVSEAIKTSEIEGEYSEPKRCHVFHQKKFRVKS